MNFIQFRKRVKYYVLKKVYRAPKKEEIFSLIKKLRPKETDKQLLRLGGEGDGGYLLPDDFEGIKACFSPGVGGKSNFELDCANRGMQIFMADASVEGPSITHPSFNFQKKFLGKNNRDNFITLKEWLRISGIEKKDELILQMDIEGYEYDVLQSTSLDTLNQFRIIIIEFHVLSRLGLPFFFQGMRKGFEKLLVNHICVHIHPNNCRATVDVKGMEVPLIAEFTFLRKDRVKQEKPVKTIPHPLDSDCIAKWRSTVLPEIWYQDIIPGIQNVQ